MQTSYVDELVQNIEGGLADSGHHDVASRVNIAAAVPFGRGVIEGAANDEVLIPSATGFVFEGIAVAKHKAKLNSSGEAEYDQYESISTLRKGRVWVLAEAVISKGDPVYLRHTANAGTTAAGRFGNIADTARADQITNARWLTTTTAIDQLALVEINLP